MLGEIKGHAHRFFPLALTWTGLYNLGFASKGFLLLSSKETEMVITLPFDTLEYAEKLEHAGIPASQAAKQSKVLAEVLGRSVTFAEDWLSMERNVTAKIEATKLKLKNKMSIVAGEVNLLKWMTGTGIALSIAILVKLFVH